MNHIMRLEATLAAQKAQIDALETGIRQLKIEALKEETVCAYSVSEPARAAYAGQMARRLTDLECQATLAYDNAELNELGPYAKDGSHFDCAHERGCNCGFYHERATASYLTPVFHAETCPVRANGWHCGECGAALPKDLQTVAQVDDAMRSHWRTTHRKAS